MSYLEFITNEGQKLVQLTDRSVSIGRGSNNVVEIAEDRASRQHCVIEKTGEGYVVRDLDSKNGTRVNGNKVSVKVLRPGDEVQIGATRIVFRDPDAKPVARKKTAPAPTVPAHNPLAGAENFELPDFEDEPAASLFDPGKKADSRTDVGSDIVHLLKVGSERSIRDSQIRMLNARGQVVHEAAGLALKDEESDAGQAIQIFRRLLAVAFEARASDLHFEPKAHGGTIRIRVDGTMVDAMQMEGNSFPRLMNLVKVLADIDIAQKSVVQEGHFRTILPTRTVDFRVSFTPAVHGQKLVIRILDAAAAPQHMEQLQLPDWMLRDIRITAKQTAGMILACGPTGSGKTTTLYAILRDMDRTQRNVITIEDPVEYQIDGVTHIPANIQQGNSFNTLLRSVLRQDPDVILLGEIRDRETAQTAMQAAMTGHLVLSTVHAKDTMGTIFRLLDLGVEPYLLGASLNLILAQRLVRLLCPNCKQPRRPQPTQIGHMGRAGQDLKHVYYPVGCPKCLNVGYLGRRGLFELLTVNNALRDAILNSPTITTIRDALKRTLFISLPELGWQYVAEGVTSPDEVERIVGTTS